MITGKKIDAGCYLDMPDELYHSAFGAGSSDLRRLLNSSPGHLWHDQTHGRKPPTADMLFGSLFHLAMLQPDLWAEKVCQVPADAPKRPSPAQINAKKPSDETLKAVAFWDNFNALSAGKLTPDQEAVDRCQAMIKSIKSHSSAMAALSGGQSEVSAFGVDPETGVTVKARFDRLPTGGNAIVDIKTCACSATEPFLKHSYEYGYHIQAAYYKGLSALAGDGRQEFCIVAVEKSAPYPVNVFRMTEKALAKGQEKVCEALMLYAACERANDWPLYGSGVQELDLPFWVK